MTRAARLRTALVQALPTLLTLPLLGALAAFGLLPWSVLVAVPLALSVQATVMYLRLRPRA